VNPEDMTIFDKLLQDTSVGSWRLKVQADVPLGCCRLVSQQQDIQIDPEQAIRATLEQLRMRLQGEGGIGEAATLL